MTDPIHTRIENQRAEIKRLHEQMDALKQNSSIAEFVKVQKENARLRSALEQSKHNGRAHHQLAAGSGLKQCDIDGCARVAWYTGDGVHLVRCALHEIASYNAEELRSWGEDNGADMVAYAREQLKREEPVHSPDTPGDDR